VGSEEGDFFEDAGPEPDFIDAKGGPDHIETAGGDDYIDAGEGDDQVFSDLNWHDPGDDVLIGGSGSDILVSDGGDDRLYGDHRVGLAEAIADVSATTSPLKGDWLAGGEGDDALIGSASSDVFAGGGGEDILVGGAGNDFLMGDADYRPVRNWEFSVRADGRPGPFTTGLPEEGNPVSSAADAIYGGSGDDWAWAGRGDDTIDGGSGRDLLLGGLGSDMIVGGDGDDTLAAGDMNRLDLTDPGNDYLDGGPGNDTLYGSAGDTMLFGGEGDDRIFAGPGADFIDAGPGNDRIGSSGGADFIDGGDGDDVVTASFFSTDGVSIHGGEGADTLRSGLGEDALFGGAGDDALTGDEASDLLDGGTGNDRYFVKPGNGADEIFDEVGDDVLEIESLEGIAPERAVSRDGIRLADGEDGRVSLFYGILGDRIDLGAEPFGVIERIEIKHYWTGVDFTLEVIEFFELWDAYLVATLPPNSAPDLTQPLPSASTLEDELFGYVLPADAFVDPDADDVLSYSASLAGGATLPAWLSFDPVTLFFSGVPANVDVGSFEVAVTATDLFGATTSGGFLVSVANANDAPQTSGSIGSQTAEEESRFELALPADLFVDEDDGDGLSWSARLANGAALPDWLVFDSVAKTLSGTPTRAAVGEWSIALSVSDESNATASLAFALSVTKAPGQTLSGGDGSEALQGGPGDDTLLGSIGADALIGGKGDDTFVLAADGLWRPGYAAYNAGSPGSPGTGRIVGVAGKSRLFDTLDGGDGIDTVLGTTDHDAVFLDDGLSPFPDVMRARLGDVERFLMGSGNDVVDLTSFNFALGAVRIEGEDGDDLLWASAGDDALLGGAGRDELYGGAGADYLAGNAGDDSLDGAYGADVLQGGDGDDTLLDPSQGGLLDGGTGNDALTGGAAAELFAGGRGNDSLRPGGGSDVVLFNRGDGADRVAVGTGAKTFSLGGGIAYEDFALERTSNHLIVHLGGGERVEFTDWYSATANAGFRYMQVIAEAMDGFNPAGTDPLRDNKIERFNFAGIVEAFDAARTADPMIARWQAMEALLDAHLAGSDDEALGGELAYRYGLAGTFAGHGLAAAKTALQSPDLGAKPQAIAPGPSIPADPLLG
jgi:Ca2+-binding RTX toxin-like protein